MTAVAMSTPLDSPTVSFWRRYWPVLLLALLPLIPLYRAVFMGEAIGPFEQIRQMAPWNGPKPAQPWDVLQADGVLQFYVWRDLVFDAWGKGQMPFWNPYQLAGTPLLANSQSGALYPPHILMGLLHVPTAAAMTLLAWFHLFWAGLGAYMLCKALGGNKLGAFIGGASFSLSSFMIAWTALPSIIETVSWIPWTLAFVLVIFDRHPTQLRPQTMRSGETIEDGPMIYRQTVLASRQYALVTLWLGVSIGMMILAGHLQFVAYGFIAVGLLVVWLLATRRSPLSSSSATVLTARSGEEFQEVDERRMKQFLFLTNPSVGSTFRVALATILGFCIAAPQLLAVMQYSQFSHRRNTPTAAGYEAYIGNSIQPYELVKILVPSIQGNPRQMASDQLPVSTYYPAVLKLGANFAESAIGLGIFVVILLCLLPQLAKLREPIWGVLLFGAVGFLLALGTPLNKLFYFGVPGWSSTGSPGRAICLFVLAACVGAGLSASRLAEFKQLFFKQPSRVGFTAVGFVLICCICALCKNTYELRPGLNREIIDMLKEQAEAASMSSILGVVLLSILALVFAVKEQSVRSKALLIAVPILSCVTFFGTSLVMTGPPDLHVKNSVGMKRIAPINATWDILSAVHATLPPNLSALNRIHSLDGYDSLLHKDTVALLQDIEGPHAAAEVNGNMMLIKPTADWKKLADAGVSEVWSREPIPELGDVREESGLWKYPLNGPGRASTPAGPAEILSESLSQIKVKATGPGRLVIRDRNMPGWLPKVDGAHVTMGGTTWMEIELPAGDHQVELNYVPPGFMTGMFLALPAWLIVFLLVFRVGLIRQLRAKGS